MRFNKRGQQTMGLPYGMIFAIFLIVVFVVIAFIAIRHFLNIGQTADIGMFYDELQREVNDAQRSGSRDDTFKVDLPDGIETICFANLSSEITNPDSNYEQIKYFELRGANTFLLPPESAKNLETKEIININITKMTIKRNPYCISVSDDIKIKKDFYDKLVTLS
jgi:hypothetical protein